MSKTITLHKYTGTFATGHCTDDYHFYDVDHFATSIEEASEFFQELADMRDDEFVDIFQIDDKYIK